MNNKNTNHIDRKYSPEREEEEEKTMILHKTFLFHPQMFNQVILWTNTCLPKIPQAMIAQRDDRMQPGRRWKFNKKILAIVMELYFDFLFSINIT